jgi:hypothetical protein
LPSIFENPLSQTGAFRAVQLIPLSTGMQVQATIAAVVSQALTENCRWWHGCHPSKTRRDQPEQRRGWNRLMAIAATATGASIQRRRGLFLGQLMLHTPNYDALNPENLPFMTQTKPSKVEPGSIITRSTGSGEHERLGFSNHATRHVCCILHGNIRSCVDDIQNPPP